MSNTFDISEAIEIEILVAESEFWENGTQADKLAESVATQALATDSVLHPEFSKHRDELGNSHSINLGLAILDTRPDIDTRGIHADTLHIFAGLIGEHYVNA